MVILPGSKHVSEYSVSAAGYVDSSSTTNVVFFDASMINDDAVFNKYIFSGV